MKQKNSEFIIDPDHKDILGADPFLLRQIDTEKKHRFHEALTQHALNIEDLDLSRFDTQDPSDPQRVPHRFFLFGWAVPLIKMWQSTKTTLPNGDLKIPTMRSHSLLIS